MTSIVFTILAVILRIISNPLGNVFQKQLTNKGHHPLVVNFITYLLLSLPCIFFAIGFDWRQLPGAFWLYAISGGIAGALGNGFLVKALQKGDLSVLGPINSYKSIVGIVIGIFLLNEFPNLWGLIGIALIVYGSYFVLESTEDKFTWGLLKRPEIKFRIWAMILTAIEAVLVKKVILFSSTTIAFITWCWFGALFSFLLLLVNKIHLQQQLAIERKERDINKYIFLILCIGIMQFTTNYVFEHMPVGYALSLFQLSIIVSVLLGHRIFNETDIRKKLIGSGIMIIGSIVIILFKGR